MKEQWKKLDSDAKLLVNVEEGKPLPIKIELPISALVANKDDCCKKFLTILRVLILALFLLFLSWVAVCLLAYCVAGASFEVDKISINGDSIYNKNDNPEFRNKIYQSSKEDQSISDANNLPVMPPKLLNNDFATAKEPGFISKPNNDIVTTDENEKLIDSMKTLNEMSKKWKEMFEKMHKVEQVTEGWVPSTVSEEWHEPTKKETSPEETFSSDNFDSNNNEQNSIISSDEVVVNSQNEKEKEKDNEIVDLLFHLFNAIAFDEQMSVEDVGFTKQISSKQNSAATDEANQDKSESNGSIEQQTTINEEKTESTEEITTEPSSGINGVPLLEFDSLMIKYLEPVVGENNEMLVWYYQNRNNPNFETDNDRLKVYTAKLLYSANIAEYLRDLEVVLDSLLQNDEFVEDLKLLTRGELKSMNSKDYSPVQYQIFDRISTKINMNKLIEEDPKVIEVFSRMIETYNRLELSQSNINPDDLLLGEIDVKPGKSLFVTNPQKSEKQRLSVLQAIRKVANDEVVSSEDEFEMNPVAVEQMKNIINAIKKIAIDDDAKGNGVVEFVEQTTPDKVATDRENESNIEKYAETIQEPEEEQSNIESDVEYEPSEIVQVTEAMKDDQDLKKPEKSKDEVKKQWGTLIEMTQSTDESSKENAYINEFIQAFGDFYDY